MNGKIALAIDGMEITSGNGMSILQAALANGIYIPHLCYHPDLEPAGACRLCMVEVKGRGLTTACNTPVAEGMVVNTETPEIDQVRRTGVELLMVNHGGDCLQCFKNTHCELQNVAKYIGVDQESLEGLRRPSRTHDVDNSNPFFRRDPNKCVLCGICVRTCKERQCVRAIDFAFRGFSSIVTTFGDRKITESTCESCGECVVRCPVGALAPKGFQQPAREVKTVCPYCGCGCGIYLGVRGDNIVSTRGDAECPANHGALCVKGRFGHEFVNHPDRLTKPLIKQDGAFVEATWDEALSLVTQKFAHYEGEQFATISSAKCTNEENYIIQKFTRAVMGTNNIDHCARLCHAPSVTGLVQSLGSGAMTNSIDEIGKAACIFAIGTNTTAAHPIIGLQIKKAVAGGCRLIVANPREVDLCRFADIFLQHRPGSDVALLMGLAAIIVKESLVDAEFVRDRCENFEAFQESLKDFNIDFVEQVTGVPREKLIQAAVTYATQKPASILYAMGITQHTHGTDNVLATSNLALLTGNIGKPSSGVNPLRGQNNVQGSCDLGALPNVYPGYQRVDDPEVRAKFESAWGCRLNGFPGLTHMEIFDAIDQGMIKALYLVGENPILSEAGSKHAEAALGKLDFFVVQDIFLTETAQLADVVLPAATFAEKDGTFTNTERRIQRVRKAIEPVGDSRPDWRITCEIAKRMGGRGFDFDHPAQIMDEAATLVSTYRGVSYDRLEKGTLQWPCPDSEHPGTPILHAERFATNTARGRFVPLWYRPSAEVPDHEYPLILTTERSLFHYHTATMTRKGGLAVLRSHEWLDINPRDASKMSIEDGETLRVVSRRGAVTVKGRVTDVSPPGVVSMSFHFAETPTNVLTSRARDPIAKIPETKVCAVRVEKLKESTGNDLE